MTRLSLLHNLIQQTRTQAGLDKSRTSVHDVFEIINSTNCRDR